MAKREGKRRFQSIRNVVAELGKVSWPTKEEAARLTVIVLIITVVVAIILGVIDYSFSKFVEGVLMR